MSVSEDLLCRFELMEPLNSTALKNHKKGQIKRDNMLNKSVSLWSLALFLCNDTGSLLLTNDID